VDTQTVTLFLALLAVVAQLAVASAVVLAVGGRVAAPLARARAAVAAEVGPQALLLAATVALVCTAGSLWLSEGAHFPPCKLCWYQRIAMYPLVVVLGIAARRRDLGVRLTGSVMAALGGSISIYHLVIERYPSLESAGSCDPANPCSTRWVERFGYLTIPGMALSGFALILVLLAVARPAPDRLQEEPS
jgi:disulfide bond formation protein DsbB